MSKLEKHNQSPLLNKEVVYTKLKHSITPEITISTNKVEIVANLVKQLLTSATPKNTEAQLKKKPRRAS
jgi:hypothetical protein